MAMLKNYLVELDAMFSDEHKEFVIVAVNDEHAMNTATNLCGSLRGSWTIESVDDIEGEVPDHE